MGSLFWFWVYFLMNPKGPCTNLVYTWALEDFLRPLVQRAWKPWQHLKLGCLRTARKAAPRPEVVYMYFTNYLEVRGFRTIPEWQLHNIGYSTLWYSMEFKACRVWSIFDSLRATYSRLKFRCQVLFYLVYDGSYVLVLTTLDLQV